MATPDSSDSQRIALVDTNPWAYLRQYTPARLALGRAGGSQPTRAVLDFRLAHAQARDAVHAVWDHDKTAEALSSLGQPVLILPSAAADRATYLRRPDFGRQLSPRARTQLLESTAKDSQLDVVLILSDGLSATAVERHGVALLTYLVPLLLEHGWKVGPIVLCPFGRVKLQDEIGAVLHAKYSLMILGERPGLSSPDSLGAYFTAAPGPEKTDADRNCLSNIRPEGLSPEAAAQKLVWLLNESRRTGQFGIHLKDTQATTLIR